MVNLWASEENKLIHFFLSGAGAKVLRRKEQDQICWADNGKNPPSLGGWGIENWRWQKKKVEEGGKWMKTTPKVLRDRKEVRGEGKRGKRWAARWEKKKGDKCQAMKKGKSWVREKICT